MMEDLFCLIASLRSVFRDRRELALEKLALRQQPAILARTGEIGRYPILFADPAPQKWAASPFFHFSRDDSASRVFNLRPMGVREAIAAALRNEDREFAETRWSDALSSVGTPPQWGGVRFRDRRWTVVIALFIFRVKLDSDLVYFAAAAFNPGFLAKASSGEHILLWSAEWDDSGAQP